MGEAAANVLVMDDEVDMREGCRWVLTPYRFQVTTAENGVEGPEKLREGPFDLIFLDASHADRCVRAAQPGRRTRELPAGCGPVVWMMMSEMITWRGWISGRAGAETYVAQ